MNISHTLNKKKNRLKRLVNKLKDSPLDDKKKNRVNELSAELSSAGIKV